MKVLVVQAQPADREHLVRIVKDHGGEAVAAVDGMTGLEAAAAHRPDLIISGALMLRMDGFHMLKHLKAQKELAAIPFIFYAVPYTGNREVELAYALGADAYIIKKRPLVDIWPEVEAVLRSPRIDGAARGAGETAGADEGLLTGYALSVVKELEDRIAFLEKAKAEIEQSENLYRVVVENVSDVIWMMDMTFRFVYISPASARMLQCSMAEAMDQAIDSLFTPESLQLMEAILAEELAADAQFSKDLLRSRLLIVELRRRNGTTFFAEVRVTFLRDPEGRAIGMVGVTRDISDREEELNRQPRIITEV
ncbi:MAG TPA: PAS domain S-box protein [Syntrophales bacterium]|nr:PAS domain S-box protein [Syntrophales bacterium]